MKYFFKSCFYLRSRERRDKLLYVLIGQERQRKVDFKFRDIRAKTVPTEQLLGHKTRVVIKDYTRNRIGEKSRTSKIITGFAWFCF
ncbi:protein of unknown function [Candidatus Nitrotoga arctica]|uniref:Uncharacterized protein n=1 Tax=Candidatus Nitrotoga arctica TaxID=453162 RepID=A0ABM8Z2G2_9PROT|nr:protein of unknown function [Candidatus Nitrotoga arctica]